MTETIETILFLLCVMVVVAIVARRLNIASSILLVVAGIVLAFVPGLPQIELAPELVLLGILPPLIYSAGVAMSWREFKFNLRPIILLAFGCVVFTACAVAAVGHWLLHLPLGVGFVLGAIVAPPDAVAPLAIVRRIGLPRRLVLILEGEGVANDATALILYRFAVAAVSTGLFSFPEASGVFTLIVVGEIAFGIGVGWCSLRLRRWVNDPRIEITLSLLTPYAAFLIPQQLGGSGVLATVAAGLYASWNGPLLIPAATRLQGIFFWDLLVYLLEGFVFLVTGMQTQTLLDRKSPELLHDLFFAVLITVVVVIVTRFMWMFPTVYLPRWLSPSLRKRDPAPPWQWAFFLSFVGIRGVVSLAAALAIPLYTAQGEPFPGRDLILFVTFGLIVVTLVGQGLIMPSVVRWLNLGRDAAKERKREHDAEIAARTEALNVAHERLKQFHAEGRLTPESHALLRARHEYRAGRLPDRMVDGKAATETTTLRLELIAAERDYIYQQLQQGRITDEARRRIERELDLEEASIASKQEGGDEQPL
ncbi:MAG TPA: Na+/H+ antiporter [Xanthobacteraceae bacterium]|jgi:CPA1 family monovalent cation:H+ antiporter|nr:Na+/H+ antiporter [Xanthobacteraceae bacterium]